ncbi:hypothetical protein HHI36_002438, partial [Cryptolaemus montrouzieri]
KESSKPCYLWEKVVQRTCCSDGDASSASLSSSTRKLSTSGILAPADVETIVSQLSMVFQRQFDQFKEEMRTEYLEHVAALTKKVGEQNSNLQDKVDLVSKCDIESVCVEASERVTRSKNIMLLDINESKSSITSERIKYDKDEVVNVLMSLSLGDKSSNVLKVLLLGKRDNSGPRPIKIVTSISKFEVDVLKKFKNVEHPRYRLYNDRTVLQRESMAKLIVELADRESKGKR